MASGHDGRELVEVLTSHLPAGSSVLELGMGPGVDLDILAQYYSVTGSDNSKVFLNLYRETHPDADLLVLDAEKLETDRSFDCIYSNKVLMHLSKDALCRSFTRQLKLLTEDGLVMHSFWHGSREEHLQGLRFVYYTEEELLGMIGSGYETVKSDRYSEMGKDDSFYIILRKKHEK